LSEAFTRRASYGPSSPTVGSRGAKTRRQIVDAALRSFTEKGFHATAVEDIAVLAETSRATLYQYFESKEAIFIELMHESGGALVRVTRRLGPLGPTADGYDNLHWWLGEWTWVFDRYSAMFIEWASVNSPKAPLRRKLEQFVDFHVEHFGKVLLAAGFTAGESNASSILVLALVGRFNYIRHVYRPGLSETQMLDSLASALQLFLFPDTPVAVLAAGPHSADRPSELRRELPPMADIGPLASLPPRDSIVSVEPFEGLGAQATRTVRQLMDAAARVFAANSYDATNIDQIVTEAGLARGTFYRYFPDKLAILSALSQEAAGIMAPLFVQYESVVADGDRAALRAWLHRFLDAHRGYSGVLRAWTEGFPIDPVLLAPAADVVDAIGHAIRATFGPKRAYPLDRRAAGMLFAGLVEQFPNEGKGSHYELDDDQVVETQARFVERVLLPRR
jgi:AcrR family transcriptional regulator